MPDLGNRANVMGPQPLSKPVETPKEVIDAALRVASLVASHNPGALESLALEACRNELTSLAKNAPPGKYRDAEIVGVARVNQHYFVKLQLPRSDGELFKIQLRVGQHDGRWMVWDAMNLSDKRSAWTK
jgi:hypothetical protein